MGTVVLRRDRQKAVLNHHPWIFSGAVARIEGEPADGDVVDVLDSERKFLARGYINRHSQITVRCLSWNSDEPIDFEFWERRVRESIGRRTGLLSESTTACRLVHAESDRLPGLIVDRYADHVVIQVLTMGIERIKADIVRILAEQVQPAGICERSDVPVREKEHLPPNVGTLWGEEPPPLLAIHENGHRFWVDIAHGQKTGFYLDQRENRSRLGKYCAGRTVLNAFAYSGAFAVYALGGGATSVVNVDTSAEALALARRNLESNSLRARDQDLVVGDVFAILRQYRAEGRQFDCIVLDPPKFAYSQAQVQAACRGYKDINWVAMQILAPGGILFTMSCSGLVSPDLFQKVVFGASIDAGRDAQVLDKLGQAADHPILLSFPEGEYLKGFACRMV